MINIQIKKKDLWLLSAIFIFLVGVGFIIAYNPSGTGGNPAVMGHSADEIEGYGMNFCYCIQCKSNSGQTGPERCASFNDYTGYSIMSSSTTYEDGCRIKLYPC